MPDARDKALDAALSAYWGARNHGDEHAAVQRLIALGATEWLPCPAPECVRLRNIELDFLRQHDA